MSPIIKDKNWLIVAAVMVLMLVYFLLAHPALNDDGFHYEGFAEAAAHGQIDFKNFYGFQGLSFLAVPIVWLTGSKISVIITSIILWLLSLPLAYAIGREFYDRKAGWYFLALILLLPYPYTTMLRGFQEAALLFFILLIIYGSLHRKNWTFLVWAMGGIVKPFALVLFPLWFKGFLKPKKLIWLAVAAIIGLSYLGASYYQTGHLVNNAAINSYHGNFETGHPPPLSESFTFSLKGFGRVGANLFVYSRKILISPLVVLLGLGLLWRNRLMPGRREIITAILLNFLLVGSLTFSFSKYLLPGVVLLALAAVPLLTRKSWLLPLVLVDSWLVFKPMYDYFGRNFWPSFVLYLWPLFLATIIFGIFSWKKSQPFKN